MLLILLSLIACYGLVRVVVTGHYVAYIRPDLQKQWYKFDDEHVIKCSANEAINQNFGGPLDGTNRMSHSSAYMLVYVRKDRNLKTYESEFLLFNLIHPFINKSCTFCCWKQEIVRLTSCEMHSEPLV